jgi:hypothetical protein
MADQEPGRRPEQQSNDATQRQPQQQHQQHHDPRGEGAGGGLASQTPKGGVSQDGFGQSGGQSTPS